MGRLRGKVVTSWWFESLFGGISSRFLLADHFHLLASESVFGMSQGPPTCACSSLSQDGLQRRGLWVTDITHYEVTTPLPLLTSKEPFCACIVGEVFLTSRTRNRWPFISYLDRAQPPPSSCFYGVSTIMEFLSTGEKLFSLGPIYLLPPSLCMFLLRR